MCKDKNPLTPSSTGALAHGHYIGVIAIIISYELYASFLNSSVSKKRTTLLPVLLFDIKLYWLVKM